MANELSLFDSGKAQVPAHVQKLLDERSNISDRISVPSLTYGGKVWATEIDGTRTKLVRKDEDGDDIPVPSLQVIILDFNDKRGRAYFPGKYDPDNPGAPICWSEDGVIPDAEVPDDIKSDVTAEACDKCPFSVKGSKISETGKEVQACGQHRMLVVVPAHKPDGQPLRLKLAVTSDYDKQSPEMAEKGWYAFSQYRDYLRNNGVMHTAAVVTKIRFDPSVDYPKIMFNATKWVTEDEQVAVSAALDGDEVARVLKGYVPRTGAGDTAAPGAVSDDDGDDDDGEAAAAAAKKQAQAAAAAKKKAAVEKMEAAKAQIEAEKKAEKKAAAELAAKKKAAAEKAETPDDAGGWGDADGDDEPAKPAKAAKPAKPAKAAKAAEIEDAEFIPADDETPNDLDAILSAWDSDD